MRATVMGQAANVTSIEAIKSFTLALQEFEGDARDALMMLNLEVAAQLIEGLHFTRQRPVVQIGEQQMQVVRPCHRGGGHRAVHSAAQQDNRFFHGIRSAE